MLMPMATMNPSSGASIGVPAYSLQLTQRRCSYVFIYKGELCIFLVLKIILIILNMGLFHMLI
jgi:hypothetical protein